MSAYYDHSNWLVEKQKENERKLEEKQKKWVKEQKNIILGQIKQLKGNPGDLNKVYTKKEINAIKKTDIKEFKEELMYEQKEQLKEEKRDFDYAVKNYKMLIAQCKNDYNKTKKRLSKINKENLDIIMEELNKKWEKQWGISKKGTRKNK
jgi:hypothetical protein